MLNGKKTYIGIIIMVAPILAGFFGYQITDIEGATDLLGDLAGNIEGLITVGGGLLAWYGRAVTKANT